MVRDCGLSAHRTVPFALGETVALAGSLGPTLVSPVYRELLGRSCDPYTYMNIWYRVLSLPAFLQEICEDNAFKMIGIDPPRSGRNVTASSWWRVQDWYGAVTNGRQPVAVATGAPRLPEAAA